MSRRHRSAVASRPRPIFGPVHRQQERQHQPGFTGSYTEAPGKPEFGPVAATRIACPDPQASVNHKLFEVFEKTTSVVATHVLLAVFDENDELLATLRAATPTDRWRLPDRLAG